MFHPSTCQKNFIARPVRAAGGSSHRLDSPCACRAACHLKLGAIHPSSLASEPNNAGLAANPISASHRLRFACELCPFDLCHGCRPRVQPSQWDHSRRSQSTVRLRLITSGFSVAGHLPSCAAIHNNRAALWLLHGARLLALSSLAAAPSTHGPS